MHLHPCSGWRRLCMAAEDRDQASRRVARAMCCFRKACQLQYYSFFSQKPPWPNSSVRTISSAAAVQVAQGRTVAAAKPGSSSWARRPTRWAPCRRRGPRTGSAQKGAPQRSTSTCPDPARARASVPEMRPAAHAPEASTWLYTWRCDVNHATLRCSRQAGAPGTATRRSMRGCGAHTAVPRTHCRSDRAPALTVHGSRLLHAARTGTAAPHRNRAFAGLRCRGAHGRGRASRTSATVLRSMLRA